MMRRRWALAIIAACGEDQAVPVTDEFLNDVVAARTPRELLAVLSRLEHVQPAWKGSAAYLGTGFMLMREGQDLVLLDGRDVTCPPRRCPWPALPFIAFGTSNGLVRDAPGDKELLRRSIVFVGHEEQLLAAKLEGGVVARIRWR